MEYLEKCIFSGTVCGKDVCLIKNEGLDQSAPLWCENNKDCYFKRLKEAEAKNEANKEALYENFKDSMGMLRTEIDKVVKYEELIDKIKDICYPVLTSGICNNCDGVGYFEGCGDTDCGANAIFRIIELIEPENEEELENEEED